MREALQSLWIVFLCGIVYAVLCLLGIVIKNAEAEPYKGYDILGLAMQPVKMIAEEVGPNSVVGVLAGTFGPVIAPLEALLNQANGKVIGYRAHLGNGTCLRNGVCGPGEFKPTAFKIMRKRAKDFHDLNMRHPGIKCWISPYLEYDEKNKKTVETWMRIIREELPECTLVLNPHTGYAPNNVMRERHGSTVKGPIISTDGVSFFDVDNAEYCDGATHLCFAWINRFNLRVTGEEDFVMPRQRKWKVTRDNMIQVRRLHQPEEARPVMAGCKNIVQPNLWKSNAEDYGVNADGRGDRPLFIVGVKTDKFTISKLSGGVVGCARYYGPFESGLHRYYVGSCSGDSGVTLMDKAQNEWVKLEGAGQCFVSNTIRRKGYFR